MFLDIRLSILICPISYALDQKAGNMMVRTDGGNRVSFHIHQVAGFRQGGSRCGVKDRLSNGHQRSSFQNRCRACIKGQGMSRI